VGRVLRADDIGQFSTGSGLAGKTTDWMAVWQLDTAKFGLTNRLLFDDDFAFAKAELQAAYTGDRYGMAVGFVHTMADPKENRETPASELTVASSYQFSPGWAGRVASRYDFEADRAAKAGVGLTFRNECLLVDLSLSRRFTSSTSVKPTTDFGLSVELLGFGGASDPGVARQCRR
jgi:LPS-assembly protein